MLIDSQSSTNNTNKSLFTSWYLLIDCESYLTKLTDHQLYFMSDKDLESFDLNLENSDVGSDDDDESDDEYDFPALRFLF